MMKKTRNTRDVRVPVVRDFRIKGILTYTTGDTLELSTIDIKDSTLKEAIDRVCDLQDEFDQDSDPVRVYLFNKDDTVVPVYAAYARFYDYRQLNTP